MVELQKFYQWIVGFPCYSYMKLSVYTVIYYCHYHQTIRVQLDQCRMPLLLQAKYIAEWCQDLFWCQTIYNSNSKKAFNDLEKLYSHLKNQDFGKTFL